VRKGKGRRSTVRLIREFALRNVRQKAPRKAQDLFTYNLFYNGVNGLPAVGIVSFHRMEKKKKELNQQKISTQ
jgi:hypothetical protein